jgi:phosphoglucosamine mutase
VALRFGTDGVRGVAGAELTPEFAVTLGRAAARVLDVERVVIGRDPRLSGPMLEGALAAGFAAEGVAVDLLGVIPTPGVAYIAKRWDAAAAVISASHNLFADNGIKLFARGGRKLPDDVEARIEAEVAAIDRLVPGRDGDRIGTVAANGDGLVEYGDHLVALMADEGLDGLRLVLDCANGAASSLAASVFERAGAEVLVINDQPDGCNINDRCGTTHPERLRLEVVEVGADAGLAFDGDADRLIAVDHMGAVVDGDHIIAICAEDLQARDLLRDHTVVVTVMTNLGFRLAMTEAGIKVVETPVGDRYVLEALEAGGYSLGGEQSGHVIFPDLAVTGDGLLSGLVLLDVVRRRGVALADLAAGAMTRLPQVLVNVRVTGDADAAVDELAPHTAAAQALLGERGRVLVRASGTEPLVRVMVEAEDEATAHRIADELAERVERRGPRPEASA